MDGWYNVVNISECEVHWKVIEKAGKCENVLYKIGEYFRPRLLVFVNITHPTSAKLKGDNKLRRGRGGEENKE